MRVDAGKHDRKNVNMTGRCKHDRKEESKMANDTKRERKKGMK